jgi:hypothetical protein
MESGKSAKIAGEDFSRNKKHKNRLALHRNSRVRWSREHTAVLLHRHFRSAELPDSHSHQLAFVSIKSVFANQIGRMRAVGCVRSFTDVNHGIYLHN